MINGVLVERTVQDVVPALKTNAEGLKKVLNDLVKQYQTKQEELDKWKVCYVVLVFLFFGVISLRLDIGKKWPTDCFLGLQKKNNVQVVQS